MSSYYVYYEELVPGPRTLYFSGPIRSKGARRRPRPNVGDVVEFRTRQDPWRSVLRAQIRSIERIDDSRFRFSAEPCLELGPAAEGQRSESALVPH